MVVKIRVPVGVLNIIRHLIFRGYPKRDPHFNNHPFGHMDLGVILGHEAAAAAKSHQRSVGDPRGVWNPPKDSNIPWFLKGFLKGILQGLYKGSEEDSLNHIRGPNII